MRERGAGLFGTLARLGIAAAAIAATLALAEGALRLGGAALRWKQERWRDPGASAASSDELRVLCLGESTTAPAAGDDWPRQLQGLLSSRAGRPVRVINEGQTGSNTLAIARMLPAWLEAHRPSIVIAMMGINDTRWYGLEASALEDGWKASLRRLRLWKLARAAWASLEVPSADAGGFVFQDCFSLQNGGEGAELKAGCEKALRAALRRFPDAWRWRIRLADLLMESGRLQEAEDELRTAVDTAPRSWQTRLWLGKLLSRQRRIDESQEELRRAARLADSFEAHRWLALAFDKAVDVDDARRERRAMLRIAHRPDAELDRLEARALDEYNGGRIEEARRLAERLLPIERETLYHLLIKIYMDRGDLRDAERVARRMPALGMDLAQLAGLSQRRLYAGDPREARGMCIEGLRYDRLWGLGYACLANIDLATGHRQRAEGLLERAVELSPYQSTPNDSASWAFATTLEIFGRQGGTPPPSLVRATLGVDRAVVGGAPMTAANYREIAERLEEAGIPLFAMQYPTLPVEPLRETLAGLPGIRFIENRSNFERALKSGRYEDYFLDRFAHSFGHCTRAGNRLIAEQVAEELERSGVLERR